MNILRFISGSADGIVAPPKVDAGVRQLRRLVDNALVFLVIFLGQHAQFRAVRHYPSFASWGLGGVFHECIEHVETVGVFIMDVEHRIEGRIVRAYPAWRWRTAEVFAVGRHAEASGMQQGGSGRSNPKFVRGVALGAG